MKFPSLIDVAIGLAVAVVMFPSHAKGSSHPQAGDQSSTGFVPVEVAQRAITFSSNRHWHDTAGNILICAFEARSNSNMECEDKKTGVSRWMLLTDHKIPGFEIAGFQYSFVGSYGSQTLVVYYRPVKPAPAPVVAGRIHDSDSDAVQRSLNLSRMSANIGSLTINANRVVVQRAKKP